LNNGYARRTTSVLLWVVGAIVVAGAGAAAYLTQPPPPAAARATAVVAAPTIVQDSPAGLNQYVTDLAEKVTADDMVVHVLELVPDLAPEEYLEGIEARRLGASSLVEVSFIHADSTLAQETVSAVAEWIVGRAAGTEFDEASYLLRQAEERADAAQKKLGDFVRAERVFDPHSEYSDALEQIAALDRQISAAAIEEVDSSAIDDLRQQKATLEAERDRIGALLLPYSELTDELDRAGEELERARMRFGEAEYELTVVNTPDRLILSRNVEPFVDQTPRLQQTAMAAAIALVATLVILVPVGRWLGNRRVRKHRRSAESPSPARSSADVDLTELAYDRR
jgi:hypothetical protein